VSYIGGDFFQARPVREFRALLEAIVDPSNNASLLVVMQTQWGTGLSGPEPPSALRLAESEAGEWVGASVQLADWPTRVEEFSDDRFDVSDLQPLRRRVRLLNALSRRTSGLNLLTTLVASFHPIATNSGDSANGDQ